MPEVRKEAPTPEVFGPEEATAKILTEMLNPQGDKIYTVSDVTAEEIFGLTALKMYGKTFKSKIVDDWIKHFLLLRISRFRLGRREFVVMATGIREIAEEKRKRKPSDLFAGLK